MFADSLIFDSVTFDLEHVDVEYALDAFVLEANQSSAVAFIHSPGFASPEDCVDSSDNEDISLGLEGDALCPVKLDHHGDLGCPLVDSGTDSDVFMQDGHDSRSQILESVGGGNHAPSVFLRGILASLFSLALAFRLSGEENGFSFGFVSVMAKVHLKTTGFKMLLDDFSGPGFSAWSTLFEP
jgi:hypothetical protein